MARMTRDTHGTMSRRSFLLGAASAAGIVSALALAGCGGASGTGTDAGSQQSQSSGAQASTSSDTAADGSPKATVSGSVLVAYYSAQGHTEKVAQTLAGELGADLFAITPANIYSDDDLDYSDASSRVSREHEDEDLRDLTLARDAPGGWANYDTVLVGYPIWWGDAAWAMWNFASNNDFSGKTVIPFCTSISSGIGSSGSTLRDLANGTGDWQEGQRFRQDAEESDVTSWADGLRG